jgi:outer membrane protein OmpA-like peptidoglycan-associated protein
MFKESFLVLNTLALLKFLKPVLKSVLFIQIYFMQLKAVFLCLLLGASFITKAQRYYGIAHSNYAGVNGLYINPANISDNRLKIDVHLASFNALLNQNYGKIKLINGGLLSSGTELDYTKSTNSNKTGFDFMAEARLPSFMFQLDKKRALGFSIRGRLFGGARGFDNDFLKLFDDGIADDSKLANGTIINAGKASLDVQALSELNATYGQTLYNKGKHFIKGGITLKYYTSAGYSGVRYDNFSIKLLDTAINVKQASYNGAFKASTTFSDGEQFDDFKIGDIFGNPNGKGFGVDLGAVYELREGDPVSDKRYENKYKLKLGLSITDLGFVNYKSTTFNRNYAVNTNGPKAVNRYDTASFDLDDPTAYFRTIPGGITATTDNNAVKTKAPLAINIYADYKLAKHIYVNASLFTGLIGDNSFGVRQPLQVMLTPRFESSFFDFGLPISYNNLSKDVKVGVGMRLGFLFFGFDDLGPIANKKKFSGANIYAGLRVGFPYRPKKERNKKVVEKEDVPPPTVIKDKPVTDTDSDGIPDTDDKCPTTAGVAAFNGCPDTDKDGIQDSEDKCPTIAGVAAFNGCPDTDGDGIQNSEDACPEVAGKKEFKGCPDTDGDGKPDAEDDCPTVAGIYALKGCPDTDGDGVSDKDDKCIDKAGPMDNGGCPKITEQIKKRLSFAAQAIQFEVSKAVIRPVSFKQLDEVVKILNEYKDYSLVIEGHTDNSGKADKNQALSEQRAQAVKDYFIAKGIEEGRMESAGYGDSKPLVPNTSAANKAKNRRVTLDLKLKD